MSSPYLRVYNALPHSVKRRINPLDYAIQDFVRTAAASAVGEVVLDAGAGEARFARLFPEHLYIALDSCVGDKEWDYSHVNVIADLASIPFRDQSVDLALNIQVLEHVRCPAAVLSEIYRVLKPGGRLYLTAPQGWHEHQQPNDYYRFTRYSLERLLRTVGFREIQIGLSGGYFHYLGHRLTYLPKILFPRLKTPIRLFLLPLELASLAVFCFALPVACYYLDRLDRTGEFTLCYRCLAVK